MSSSEISSNRAFFPLGRYPLIATEDGNPKLCSAGSSFGDFAVGECSSGLFVLVGFSLNPGEAGVATFTTSKDGQSRAGSGGVLFRRIKPFVD